MTPKKIAIINVTFNISGAIDMVEESIGRVKDCGLDTYEREKVKKYLQEGIRLLEEAYDVVDRVKA